MPYAKRSKKPSRRRAPRRHKNRLRDRKINTLIEKRMSQIAKKEAKKSRSKTFKDFGLGSYDQEGRVNSYTTLTDLSDSTRLPLYVVQRSDEDVTSAIESYRLSEFIYVKGFKCAGMLHMPTSNSDMADVRVRLVLFSQKRQVDPIESQLLNDLPTPCLNNFLNGWMGDPDQRQDRRGITVHASKIITIRPRGKVAVNRPFVFQKFFKKPHKQEWDASDGAGINPLVRSYWFTAYTDADVSGTDSKVQLVMTARKYFFTE